MFWLYSQWLPLKGHSRVQEQWLGKLVTPSLASNPAASSWEWVRNAESQAPLQSYRIRICILRRCRVWEALARGMGAGANPSRWKATAFPAWLPCTEPSSLPTPQLSPSLTCPSWGGQLHPASLPFYSNSFWCASYWWSFLCQSPFCLTFENKS